MSIDHLAFPHITDAVFAFSDRSALLALRGASRMFGDRADAQLFAHLAVHVADDTTYLCSPSLCSPPSSPSSSNPQPPPVNLPFLPFPLIATQGQQRTLSSKLAHARVVDLHSPIPVDYSVWFRTFDVVRRATPLAGTGFLLPAHTYVEYLDLREDVGLARRRTAVGDWLAEIPDGVSRSVIHLTWTRGCRDQVTSMGKMYLPRGVDVVVLLEPDGEEIPHDKVTNVLLALLRTAKRVVSAASMTIVGLERLSLLDLGGDAELEWQEDGERGKLGAIRDAVHRGLDERGLPRRVDVRSWDEWRATSDTELL